MSGNRAAWILVVAASTAGLACGSNVTVETSGAGGTAHTSSAAGGEAGSAEGGASTGVIGGMGGGGTGGALTGGASTGGASMGGTGGALTGGSGGAGGGMVCPGLGDPCTGCMSAQCSGTYCACTAEPHCGGYLECLGTCMPGDAACAQNCATVHEAGISAGILLADCAGTTCDADCNFGKALADCQKCLYTDCSKQMNACIADAECLALVQCVGMCPPGDMGCGQTCVMQHPDGFSKASDVRTCRIAKCNDACQ